MVAVVSTLNRYIAIRIVDPLGAASIVLSSTSLIRSAAALDPFGLLKMVPLFGVNGAGALAA